MYSLESTVTSIVIHRSGLCPVIGEQVIRIELENEGRGYFFVVSQDGDEGKQTLRVDMDELRALVDAGERLMNQRVVRAMDVTE